MSTGPRRVAAGAPARRPPLARLLAAGSTASAQGGSARQNPHPARAGDGQEAAPDRPLRRLRQAHAGRGSGGRTSNATDAATSCRCGKALAY